MKRGFKKNETGIVFSTIDGQIVGVARVEELLFEILKILKGGKKK